MTALTDAADKRTVRSQLGERPVDLVDTYVDSGTTNPASEDDVPRWDKFLTLRGPRVARVVGDIQPASPLFDLALSCLHYGLSAEFEYAAFPEQQILGGGGRGYWLDQQFNELLTELAGSPGGAGQGLPRGNFPPPARPVDQPFGRHRYDSRNRW